MPVWEVSVEMEQMGVQTFNTFQVVDIGGGGGPFASRAERIRDAWEDHIMGRLSGDIQLVNVLCKDVGSSDEEEASSTETGGLGGDNLAVNSCVQFTKVASGGRNGRMYIAGLAEQSVDAAGLIAENVRSDTEAAFNAFLAQLVAADLQMLIAKEPYLINRQVTAAKVPKYIVTQRRRLGRARGV